MVEFITTAMTALQPEDVFAWDVVNEAVQGGEGDLFKETHWQGIPDLICKAFKAARRANPKAKLFYNDYGFETGVGWEQHKADKIFQLVKDNKDCGIDGIGFQSHIQSSYTEEQLEGIRANMQRYAAIGLEVHVTELDVKCPWDHEA